MESASAEESDQSLEPLPLSSDHHGSSGQKSSPGVNPHSPSQSLESSPSQTEYDSKDGHLERDIEQQTTSQFVQMPHEQIRDFHETMGQSTDGTVNRSPNQIMQTSDVEGSSPHTSATPLTTPNRSPNSSSPDSNTHAWPQYVECDAVTLPNMSPAVRPSFLTQCQEYQSQEVNPNQTSGFASKTREKEGTFSSDGPECGRYGCLTTSVYQPRLPADMSESYQYLQAPANGLTVKSEYPLPITSGTVHPMVIKTEYQETPGIPAINIVKSEYQEPISSSSVHPRIHTIKTEYQELTPEFSTPRERITLPSGQSL